jgi:hypothetical protein
MPASGFFVVNKAKPNTTDPFKKQKDVELVLFDNGYEQGSLLQMLLINSLIFILFR